MRNLLDFVYLITRIYSLLSEIRTKLIVKTFSIQEIISNVKHTEFYRYYANTHEIS